MELKEDKMNCRNCGAPIVGNRCEFCGTYYPELKEAPKEKRVYGKNEASCPRCGSTKYTIYHDYNIESFDELYFVQCQGCKATTQTRRYSSLDYVPLNGQLADKIRMQLMIDFMNNYE